jgi:xanthine dehydrogenase small subunit
VTRLYAPGEDREAFAPEAWAPVGLETCKLETPRSIEEACTALARARDAGQSATLLAGGTDWIVDRHLADVSKAKEVHLVLDLGRIEALRVVRPEERDGQSRLRLGAAVTYWTIRKDPRIAKAVPMLAAMAADVGAVQIQTRGTLGGNLATASPAADGVAALMALEAEIEIAGTEGTRTVPIESFFTGYRRTVLGATEMVTAVDVRVPRAEAARWQKVGTRRAQAISKVALASVVETDDGVVTRARFGMASVAATTSPLLEVRAALEGRRVAEIARAETDAAVERAIRPIDDVRSTGEYRLHVAKALVWRAIQRRGSEAP